MLTTTTTLQPIIDLFNLHTRLLHNVTKDITEEHARAHFAGSPNHIAWITGHLVSSRYMLGNTLGMIEREPYPELFERQKGIQDLVYPTLEELKSGWDEHAEKLIAALENLSEEDLQADPPIQTPVADSTLRGFISFIAHHEAYHIGQLSLARRYFGYDPMYYM